ncbi:hypothetical protein ACTFIR_012092 [Dictyostelium discoideum]
MGADYIELNEENSSFHNQNTTYNPQLEKLDSHHNQTFSSQGTPIVVTQYSQEIQPPPKIVLQSPQYYPPPNAIITISVDDDESHFNSSLIIFILGFFVIFIWLINIRYLKSKNTNAKILATVSIVLFVISMILGFFIIIATS